jgi:hypothetical protein
MGAIIVHGYGSGTGMDTFTLFQFQTYWLITQVETGFSCRGHTELETELDNYHNPQRTRV